MHVFHAKFRHKFARSKKGRHETHAKGERIKNFGPSGVTLYELRFSFTCKRGFDLSKQQLLYAYFFGAPCSSTWNAQTKVTHTCHMILRNSHECHLVYTGTYTYIAGFTITTIHAEFKFSCLMYCFKSLSAVYGHFISFCISVMQNYLNPKYRHRYRAAITCHVQW